LRRFKPPDAGPLVRAALAEDLGRRGDVTSRALIPAGVRGHATLVARQPGVVAGLAAAARVFRAVSPRLHVRPLVKDGARVRPGARLAIVAGPLRAILTGERTALNFIQRLSGIATLTRRFVDRARPYGVRILDTRKTTPGWRALEKAAVRAGGGANHRFGLFDMVLIKDNHLALVGSPARAVALARKRARGLTIEVECDTLAQVESAVVARPDMIMLDNFRPADARRAIGLIRRHRGIRIELSGGITLATVGRLARLKPDFISVGALTHSAPALDIALDIR
jgi:nicotinate-nucleotide pyrophosphorylase (carboxylating)